MQTPLSLPHVMALPLQNLHVEVASNTLFRRYELMVQTFDVIEFWELFTVPHIFESSSIKTNNNKLT
jgi:hypothetical protein